MQLQGTAFMYSYKCHICKLQLPYLRYGTSSDQSDFRILYYKYILIKLFVYLILY